MSFITTLYYKANTSVLQKKMMNHLFLQKHLIQKLLLILGLRDPKLTSSSISKSSVDGFLNCESQDPSEITLRSFSQEATHS